MRKRGYGSLIWGGMLIILGLLLLLDNLDVLGDWDAPVWSLILAAFGLFFLVLYGVDRTQWWALIPGLVILGIAAAVFLAEQDLVEGYIVATIILTGVSLPFLLIFVSDRQHWWALIPALTMAGVAAGVFLEGIGAIGGEAVGGFVVGGISLGFVSIYLIDRQQWWALIPGGIMGVVAFFLLLATAADLVFPAALILLGLLLLRSNLGRGRRRRRRAAPVRKSVPSIDVGDLERSVEAAQPEKKRLPTLEEQIAAAIADESEVPAIPPTKETTVAEAEPDKPEPAADVPPGPEMPEPPEVPAGPEVQ